MRVFARIKGMLSGRGTAVHFQAHELQSSQHYCACGCRPSSRRTDIYATGSDVGAFLARTQWVLCLRGSIRGPPLGSGGAPAHHFRNGEVCARHYSRDRDMVWNALLTGPSLSLSQPVAYHAARNERRRCKILANNYRVIYCLAAMARRRLCVRRRTPVAEPSAHIALNTTKMPRASG